jgi:hypothetical protein
MNFDEILLDKALTALNDQLEIRKSPVIEIVVCGGSALQFLGLVDRTTKDVDVLAFVTSNNGFISLVTAIELPVYLSDSIKIVSRDLKLPENWFNSGPTDLLSQGLPLGLEDRLIHKGYGSRLTVYYISRYDQICFKLYASINGGGQRHLNDLITLNPSDDELLTAARWCLSQDASELFPHLVIDFLEKVGYEYVSEKIKREME